MVLAAADAAAEPGPQSARRLPRPGNVFYVGDSLTHDVVAAQAAGLRAVWLNRSALPCPAGISPDGEVTTLAALPKLIDAMAAEFAA